MENEELLPKPELDLPLPERELASGNPDSASQGDTLEPQKRKFHIPKIALILIFFLILLGLMEGGLYLYKNSNNNSAPTPSPSPVIQTTPTPDPTANWKTYTGQNYSMQYPADLTTTISNSELNIKNKAGDFDLVIASEPTNLDLSNYVDQKSWCTSIKSSSGKTHTIDSENSLRFEKNPCGLAGSTDIYTVHNGTAYHFSIDTQETYEQNLPTLNQILSTFKFTDFNPSCTPRPSCFDSNPRCLMPETSDMCPPSPTPSSDGKFCGGIAGKTCPSGYTCQLDVNYFDAGGTCVVK